MAKRRKSEATGLSGGFTYIELMVVLALIAVIAAMALPQLLPMVIYSTHEGAARHLANYGRSAIAHASFTRETITVVNDLENQEYWSESLPEPEESDNEMFQDDDEEFPDDDVELFRMARDELNRPEDERGSEEGEDLISEQTSRMATQFNDHSSRALRARAKRVVHGRRGILQGMGDLIDDDFRIGANGEKMVPEEIFDPLLGRTRLPEGVYIEYVKLGEVHYIDETVRIELTPLGLGSDVEFSLISEDGDVLIVQWDPVTGNASVSAGGDSE